VPYPSELAGIKVKIPSWIREVRFECLPGQSTQENSWIETQPGYDSFLRNPFKIIIHLPPYHSPLHSLRYCNSPKLTHYKYFINSSAVKWNNYLLISPVMKYHPIGEVLGAVSLKNRSIPRVPWFIVISCCVTPWHYKDPLPPLHHESTLSTRYWMRQPHRPYHTTKGNSIHTRISASLQLISYTNNT
jgi:hypothetical protein